MLLMAGRTLSNGKPNLHNLIEILLNWLWSFTKVIIAIITLVLPQSQRANVGNKCLKV